MGQITTRKRGKSWEYGFEGAKIAGKRNRITKGGFRTKADALEAGTKALAEFNNSGMHFEPSEISVSDYLDYWLESYVKPHLSYNTYVDYESSVRIHIKPSIGMYQLKSLRPDAVQKWIDLIKLKGYAKNTISGIFACLSGALRYAVMPCQYITSNPCEYVRIPQMADDKKRKERNHYICRKDDLKKIVDRFGLNTHFYIPLMLGYHLGTRIGESYGFDLLADLDLENSTIHVNQQMQEINGKWVYKNPKYESTRSIKMDSIILNILKAELVNRKKNILKYGEYYTKTYIDSDNVIMQFPAGINVPYREIMPISVRENGELLTPHSFHYCSRVIHYELGLPLFHYHCLRHTHGTLLAEHGAFPKTIQERMGHRDIKTTLETYVFNSDQLQQDAVLLFESAIS